MTSDSDIELLTIQEAADYLRISETTLFKLIKEDKLKVVKVNRRTLFKKSTLNNYINNHEDNKESDNGK